MTGLIPHRDAHGYYRGSGNWYFVPASEGTAIFIGDVVALAGAGDTLGNYATVTPGTLAAGNQWLGPVVAVAQGGYPPDITAAPNLENKHLPASTGGYVFVADDPSLEFTVGEDGVGAAIVAADIGNLGILVAGTGSTQYGRSGDVLDSSSFDSGTATGQVVLMGMVDDPSNVLGGTGATFRVKINEAMHQLATPGTTP